MNEDITQQEGKVFCRKKFGYSAALSRQNDDYVRHQINGWDVLIRQGYSLQDAEAIISADGKACTNQNRFKRVLSSNFTRVYRSTANYKDEQRNIYLKDHLFRGLFDFIKYLFRVTRAKSSFDASILLRQNGFNAPEPFVLMEKIAGPFRTDSVLVTDEIEDSVRLNQYLQDSVGENNFDSVRLKRQIISKLGDLVGRLHRCGISHGDLRVGNILVQKNAGQIKFFLIDNERTRKYKKIRLRLRLKNLVQVNMFRHRITDTDRMRFIKSYAKQLNLDRNQVRKLCRMVLRKTEKRLHIRKIHQKDN